MSTVTMEERLAQLERKVQELEERLPSKTAESPHTAKRGWRWFVGIFADSPDFDDVVRTGKEWREADRPDVEDTTP